MRHLDPDERIVISAAVRAILLRKHYSLRVCDERSVIQHVSRNRAMIEASIGHSDQTSLEVYQRSGVSGSRRVATIQLEHGRGEDVITDFSYDMATVLEDAEAIAENLRKGGDEIGF